MKHLCNPNCIYFPSSYSYLLKEYNDSNNIKHREAVYLCGYDDHRIIDFSFCDKFKENKSY